MNTISKEEIRDKMFFVNEENSNQPIAVVKVADLMKNDKNEESGKCDWYLSEIRWTDKLSVKSNGDIIDFEGRVVGHIDLEVMKGGAE